MYCVLWKGQHLASALGGPTTAVQTMILQFNFDGENSKKSTVSSYSMHFSSSMERGGGEKEGGGGGQRREAGSISMRDRGASTIGNRIWTNNIV